MPTLTDYMNRMSPAARQAMKHGVAWHLGAEPMPDTRFGYGFGFKQAWKLGGKAGAKAIAGRLAGPAFIAYDVYSGYQEGGVTGAITYTAGGMAQSVAMFGVAGHGGYTAGAGFKAFMGGFGKGAAKLGRAAVTNPYVAGAAAVLAVGAGMAYTTYKGAEMSWQYHMKSLPLETAGSTQAFNTGNAATMRQRSMMNIQRSHLNARSAFGNEAQWAHIARYRGIGRRGTM
jgi:hypothetical protein